MPLTARCHSLRPERSSGWLAFFELVPRGGRAAHFLVVGPADNLDRKAHEVALRGAQAAVRYLKEVPSQAPASTILGSVSRLLAHEAREAGAEIEFGCAVLEQDRLCTATQGRVRLLNLGDDPGRPRPADTPDTVPVSEGERYFFGRLPRGAGAEPVSHDFLARLEHGGGGDGGLVVTLTRTGEATRLDLASPEAPAASAAPPAPVPPVPTAPPREPETVAGKDPGPPPAPESGTPRPAADEGEDEPGDGSKRHEWKTVELPPRPEVVLPASPPKKPETLPMWDEVDLPESPAPDREPDESAVEEPAEAEASAPPAGGRDEPRLEPEEPSRTVAPESFSDLVSELQGVFTDGAPDDQGPEDTEEIETHGGHDTPEEPLSFRDAPDDEDASPDEEPGAVAPDGELEETARDFEQPREDERRAPEPGGSTEAGDDEGTEDGAPRPVEIREHEPVLEADDAPDPAEAGLYAPEETRGLGFWLGVTAAIIALAALVVYLTIVRPRVASESGEEASAPPASTEETAATDALDPTEPAAVWSEKFDGAVTSSPLVAGELVIFGCRDGRVYALDRATGRREWAYAAPDGFGSSPALAGDLVVIGGYDGRLYGLDRVTGEERWSRETGGRVVASPAVDETAAYVGSYGRVFTAVSLADGTPLWSRNLGSVLWASPVLGDDLVVTAGLDGVVTALDRANGRVRWQARTGGAVYSSPVIAERKVIVGSQDGSLYAFDLASGETAWSLEAGSAVDGSPGYHEGRVLVGTNEGLVLGVDVGLGRIVWRVATGGEVKSRPAFRGRLAWLTGYDGFLHGIEWLTGAEAARYPIDSSAYSSPAIGDGTAYFGTMDGRFLAVHLGGAAP